MRGFEILLILFVGFVIQKKRSPCNQSIELRPWELFILCLLTLMHLACEGYRWQMAILYILIFLIILLQLYQYSMIALNHRPPNLNFLKSNTISLKGLSFLLLFLSIFIGYNPPITRVPTPDGPYYVGTTHFHFVDSSRKEIITADTSDFRSLWGQIWYPAETTHNFERTPLIPESSRFMDEVTKDYGLPSFVMSHIDLIKSHAYKDAPIVTQETPLPVLLYSHGYLGNPGNTQVAEQLASHGYLVVGIAHTYETKLSKRQDGSWVNLKDTNTLHIFSDSLRDQASFNFVEELGISQEVKQSIFSGLNDSKRYLLDSLYDQQFRIFRERMQVWAADQRFVLNEMKKIHLGQRPGLFQGKLDLNRVGAFGDSFGGATAALFCADDAHCQASANYDGNQFGTLYSFQKGKAHLMIFDNDGWEGDLKDQDWNYLGIAQPYYRMAIKGATHSGGNILFNFPLAHWIGLEGNMSISTARFNEIKNAYILALFDQYLKGKESHLLQKENPYEEVRLTIY